MGPFSRSLPRTILFFISVLVFGACDGVSYNFGESTDTASETGATETDDQCGELPVIDGQCADSGSAVGWCYNRATVGTIALTQTAGCTPVGQSLGLISLRTVDGHSDYDLFAWVPRSGAEGYFDDDVSLALFRDSCGVEPLGETAECSYRPWLFVGGLPVDEELTVHVQTEVPADAEVEFQLIRNGAWGKHPPSLESSDSISCEEASSPHLYADLLDEVPWNGEPIHLNMIPQPPSIDAEPWMCGPGAAPLRQLGFLLRNAGDTDYQLLGLALSDGEGNPVRFNHGLFSCDEDGEVKPFDESLSIECGLATNHSMNLLIPKWDPGSGVFDRALLLQVPPGVGTEVYLTVDAIELLPPGV